MDSLLSYLVKSAIWLTAFGLIYSLFLRNERFFLLNRLFLLSGMLASIIFPLITVRYPVIIQQATANTSSGAVATQAIKTSAQGNILNVETILTGIIMTGFLFLSVKLLWQTLKVIQVIRKSGIIKTDSVKVVLTNKFSFPFSFFSYVLVNPSLSEKEIREIVAHESAHIAQKHWIDLMLTESLRTIQWFNPMAWLYSHFIRQNHEFLADQSALQSTNDPAAYKAVLINHLVGGEAIRLGHSFNYSLNKKRFTMMKKMHTSGIRKLKTFLIIPAIAIIFYAFAQPKYLTSTEANKENFELQKTENGPNEEEIKGVVVDENGDPLHGTSIIIKNTHTGTVSDKNGEFVLKGVAPDSEIVFSYMGYKTILAEPVFKDEMKIVLQKKKFRMESISVVGYKNSTPEEQSGSNETSENKNSDDPVFFVVEDPPKFPDGEKALNKFLAENIRYPTNAQEKNLEGEIIVEFDISKTGKVSNIQTPNPHPASLAEEARRVVSLMPAWEPGKQRGKPIEVSYALPIRFTLQSQ
ncbi:MAG: TonB family protein [Marinilabilia sp.]